jgi:hypothetical protein
VKVRMADLQAKLDSCERNLRSKENNYQDGGEESPESPTQRRDSLRSSPPVESPAEVRFIPGDGTSSSGGGTTTTECVQQEIFEFSNSLLSERCNRSNETENDGVQNFSPPAIGYVQDKEHPRPGKSGTNGT